jgi:hypothetical protein
LIEKRCLSSQLEHVEPMTLDRQDGSAIRSLRIGAADIIQGGPMTLLPLLLSMLAAVPAPAHEVSPEMIREAIAHGKKKGRNLEGHYRLCGGWCLFGTAYAFATLRTPFLIVARAAAVDPSFSETDVTPEMIAPEVRVEAFPTSGWSVTAVLIFPPHGAAIQPIRSEKVWPYESHYITMNPGASYDRSTEPHGIVAFFPLSAMRAGNELRAFMEGGRHRPHVYKQRLDPRKVR